MQKRAIQILSVLLLLGLLLWGGISTIAYLGAPVHDAVLVDEATKEVLKPMECANNLFACGLVSLYPSMRHTVERAAPFLGYAVSSAILFLVLWVLSFLRTGQLQMLRHDRSRTTWLQIRVRPIGVLLAFLFFVWLMFTTLSLSESGGISMRQIAEPSLLVYTDASPSVLEQLKVNFKGLQERGCLKEIGSYANSAKVYHMSAGCMQQSFVTRVLPVFVFAALFLLELLVLGRMILRSFRFASLPLLLDITVSAGVGGCAWVALIWTLAVAHIAIAPVAWALVITIPLVGFRHTRHWLRTLVAPGEEREVRWFGIEILLLWLLLTYLALNFITVIRPFPIGWDDLGSYLNRPRLMVSYGAFIHSMAPFQWEYLTSLGYLLFGYGSIFGATTSMMVNWMAGLLALLTVASFTQAYLGKHCGLMAALLYYSLPLVGHFSFADMKVDNAVFTMGALSMLTLFFALFPRADVGEVWTMARRDRLRWLALSGALAGFAFGMKPTMVMVLMASLGVLLGAELHGAAFFGVVSFAVAVYSKQGVLDVTAVMQRMIGSAPLSPPQVFWCAAALGCVLIGIACVLRLQRVRPVLLSLAVFVVGFGTAILPWVYHNNVVRGHLLPVRLDLGAPNNISPDFDIDGTSVPGGERPTRVLPPELRVDKSQPACTATGGKEELDRYWGYRKDWTHFVMLPWRTVLNLDSAGYYVTTSSFLFLFPLLLLLPYLWMRRGRWLLWLFAATAFLIMEWMFLANGIPWYGIGMFLGLAVATEALVARAPDVYSRISAGILITIALVASFGQRIWQYEFQRNLLEYPFGKISAQALQERTISHYDDIAADALQRNRSVKDRPYLYRVGTFIPYFIPRNLEVIGISDHQLDFFNCVNAERKPELTLKRLQALGFNSIVFDTNTATIEKDTNGSLHQKVNAFLDFVNTRSLGIKAVVNDPDGGVVYILLPL